MIESIRTSLDSVKFKKLYFFSVLKFGSLLWRLKLTLGKSVKSTSLSTFICASALKKVKSKTMLMNIYFFKIISIYLNAFLKRKVVLPIFISSPSFNSFGSLGLKSCPLIVVPLEDISSESKNTSFLHKISA